MLLIDYDEIDFDSIKRDDILCRKHFPYKPMQVVAKFETTVQLKAIGKNVGVIFSKTKLEFNESNYIRPKLDELE